MFDLSVEDLSMNYGDSIALDGVSFTAKEGEFLTLLGPSGCGKTTTLMSLAGLNRPTGGSISCGGESLFDAGRRRAVAAEHRGFGVVFQSYAIWPHMTVERNVGFPLKLRRTPTKQARDEVQRVLELVSMGGYAKRYPHELSGGQQQRVALARALVYSPRVLLLDEPLSNLDAKLREEARSWLKELQERVGLTTILVTHDQDEALALSDRIVVMNKGKVEQIGTPDEIYHAPANAFVATFVGTSNLLPGRFEAGTATAPSHVVLDTSVETMTLHVADHHGMTDHDTVTVAIRPEEVLLHAGTPATNRPNCFAAEVVSRSFLGSRTQYTVRSSGVDLTVVSGENWHTGPVFIEMPQKACRIM